MTRTTQRSLVLAALLAAASASSGCTSWHDAADSAAAANHPVTPDDLAGTWSLERVDVSTRAPSLSVAARRELTRLVVAARDTEAGIRRGHARELRSFDPDGRYVHARSKAPFRSSTPIEFGRFETAGRTVATHPEGMPPGAAAALADELVVVRVDDARLVLERRHANGLVEQMVLVRHADEPLVDPSGPSAGAALQQDRLAAPNATPVGPPAAPLPR